MKKNERPNGVSGSAGGSAEDAGREDFSGVAGVGGEAEMDRVVEPEYASVSGTAIVALALTPLGLLSLKTIYFHLFGLPVPILLIIPLISLGVALVAVHGIRLSEGTRVGVRLATAAAVVSGVIFFGSGVYHGHHIHQQHSRIDNLTILAARDMQLVFTGRYDNLYSRMVLNNPKVRAELPFDEWSARLDELLYSGGNYYGSRLEAVRMFRMQLDEQVPGSAEELLGVVVRRLVFREGSADLVLNYLHQDSKWHLMSVYAQAGAEFGRAEMTPIPRWEDELTGGQPSHAPAEFLRRQEAARGRAAEEGEPQQ